MHDDDVCVCVAGVKYQQSPGGGDEQEPPSVDSQIEALKHKIKHFKANGIIFWRDDLDDNTPLKLRFASLMNGLVDIYSNEEEYVAYIMSCYVMSCHVMSCLDNLHIVVLGVYI